MEWSTVQFLRNLVPTGWLLLGHFAIGSPLSVTSASLGTWDRTLVQNLRLRSPQDLTPQHLPSLLWPETLL